MDSKTPSKFLRKYTDLPALFKILHEHTITLLDPNTWDDSNDSHYLSQYKEKNSLKALLALCFSQAGETYHHWKVFSQGTAGACVVFNRPSLLLKLKDHPDVMAKEVKYLTIRKNRENTPRIDDLPFLKRLPFKPEKEFRVVYSHKTNDLKTYDIEIDLSCIQKISLSPWLHESLVPSTVKSIQLIKGCEKIKVYRSTLVSNEQWKSIGEQAKLP